MTEAPKEGHDTAVFGAETGHHGQPRRLHTVRRINPVNLELDEGQLVYDRLLTGVAWCVA